MLPRDDMGFTNEISMDVIMLRDRHYFEAHPDCDRYIREIIPGEIPEAPAGVTLFDRDGSEIKYMMVIKTKNPDMRIRTSLSEKQFKKLVG